ncbi:MAG: metal-dependent hydrolase [Acidobacteria bacterium]|nr:metal-dependent hydrolase [Acidobacteriota bacterium]MBI3423133.1 metal-dependent hydrolase [Acidobacteriota bacterium]
MAKTTMWRRIPHGVGIIGAIGAMAPDLDVLIFSPADPTLGWLYHRHFTHSLLLIPLVGLFAALPFLWLKRYANYRGAVVLAAIIGCATHTLLDSLTNYGTQQLWPFADTRIAWDAMPIVDPIYSLILVAGLVYTAKTRKLSGVRWGLALALFYVGFGFWQHQRGRSVQQELLASRKHLPTQARVLPAPGWLVFWRSLYIADGRLYADGIQLPWFRPAKVLPGASAAAITFTDLPASAQAQPETWRQFKILDWFAGGYLAPVPGQPTAVGDMRITAAVESLTPLWGLQFDADGLAQRWVPTAENIQPARDYRGLLHGLLHGDERYHPLSEWKTTLKEQR